MENLKNKPIESLRTPPSDALKKITGGRLNGKTDINPQWRIDAMNSVYGVCGFGWQWELRRVWNEPGSDNQVFAFAEVAIRIKSDDLWSEWVPGTGGSMLVEKESRGLHSSDEGYKMAITDALSVAFKFFGVGAEIYRGHEQGKYSTPPIQEEKQDPRVEKIGKLSHVIEGATAAGWTMPKTIAEGWAKVDQMGESQVDIFAGIVSDALGAWRVELEAALKDASTKIELNQYQKKFMDDIGSKSIFDLATALKKIQAKK